MERNSRHSGQRQTSDSPRSVGGWVGGWVCGGKTQIERERVANCLVLTLFFFTFFCLFTFSRNFILSHNAGQF